MFWGCTSLKEISLPEGLESIGWGCFKGSGLEEITIPKSVKRIDGEYVNGHYYGAFYECTSLRKVVFQEGSELKEL